MKRPITQTLGMLLSPFGDLLHTSILCRIVFAASSLYYKKNCAAMLVERKTKNFPSTYNHKVMFKDLQRLIGSKSDVNRSTISPQEKLLLARLRDKRFGYGTLLFIRIRVEYVEATAALIIS